MTAVFVLALAFGGVYAALRSLEKMALEQETSQSGKVLAGILSWLIVLIVFGWGVAGIYLLVDIFTSRHVENLWALMLMGMLTGAFFQLKETIDSANVLQLVRKALWFQPYGHQKIDLKAELSKANVKQVYKDVTGKTLVDRKKEWKPMDAATRGRVLKELDVLKQRKVVSPHVDSEVRRLQEGEHVDLSDSWKINTLRHEGHELYSQVFAVKLDPMSRILSVKIEIRSLAKEYLQEAKRVFRLKQDIYDFLQALRIEGWMQPYAVYFDRIQLSAHLTEDKGFGQPFSYSFLQFETAVAQLVKFEGKFFNAADLHTIGTLAFNGGNPLDEPLDSR